MFFSQFVLSKKGPLARIWLAAHWDKKLTKTQISQTNISRSIESIVNPDVPMALRMSGHLLLGIVRIYSRKVRYLLTDCNEALVKVKMAFRPGIVDMPADQHVATYASITLPEHMANIDYDFPDINFADLATEEPLLNLQDFQAPRSKITIPAPASVSEAMLGMDDFDFGGIGGDVMDIEYGDVDTGFPDIEIPRAAADVENVRGVELPIPDFEGSAMYDDGGFDMPAIMTPEVGTRISAVTPRFSDVSGRPSFSTPLFRTPEIGLLHPQDDEIPVLQVRKRKLVAVDENTMMSREELQRQMQDTSNLVKDLVLAPPTKKAMYNKDKELAGADHLLQLPNIEGMAPELLKLFSRNVTVEPQADLPRDAVEDQFKLNDVGDGGEFKFDDGGGEFQLDGGEFKFDGGGDFGYDVQPPVDDGGERDELRFDDEPQPGLFPEPVHDNRDDPPRPSTVADEADAEGDSRSDGIDENQRTRKMMRLLENRMDENSKVSYAEVVSGKSRRTVVVTFFQLMVLKSNGAIDLVQNQPYGDITVTIP